MENIANCKSDYPITLECSLPGQNKAAYML